ncbi:MAG: ATP-dependent helicase [Thiohalobacterales bacterium]|nr:ATP-dependent helicase [Thiohalobacterales bacterium]
MQQFARGICQWHAGAGGDRPADELAKELIEEIGYRQWLRDACRDRRHEETCLENVDEFLDWLRRLSRSLDGGGLAEVLSRLALMDMLDRQEGDAAGEAVSLMTLHAAKGLEFSHVLLVGFEEDMLPHRSSVEAETVEEERRLAYVGMTRAMRGLVITYCERRTRFGEAEQCAPSRFLAEMPEELLDWEGREAERSQEERRERGRAAIADLRQLLVDT